MIRTCSQLTLVVMVSLMASLHRSQGAEYVLIDLGHTSLDYGLPIDINNKGHVLIEGQVEHDFHSYIYKNGTYVDTGKIGSYSEVFGINDSDQVVGYLQDGNSDGPSSQGFIWQNGSVQRLDPIGTFSYTFQGQTFTSNGTSARAINNAGQVTGNTSVAGTTQSHVYLYDGTMHDVAGPPPNSTSIRPMSINDQGVIVGHFSNPSQRAFVLNGGTFTNLTGPSGITVTDAQVINNQGQILLEARPTGTTNYFYYLYDNGQFDPLDWTKAEDMNNYGAIVGYDYLGPNQTNSHGMMYLDGVVTDLNSLLPPGMNMTVREGISINDRGQILALGQVPGEDYARYIILSPIPEPSTLMLALLGIVPVVWHRHRRQKSLPSCHRISSP